MKHSADKDYHATMKASILFLLTLILLNCTSEQVQKGFVLDNEKVLTSEQVETLNNLVLAHEEKTTNQIAIVTTSSWGDNNDPLLFAADIGNKLGIGQADKDNGVTIAFSKTMRGAAIATGLGTEKVLSDEKTKQILDSLMFPKFREGQYYEGLFSGTKAIIDFLELPGNEIK